jgi:hypothetical protein
MNVLEIIGQGGCGQTVELDAKALTIAGWTGRSPAAVQHHIDELSAIGVAAPTQIPTLYRVACDLLTTKPIIEVVGNHSSGEAEFCLFNVANQLYVTVASDHTDRTLEVHDITLSKQACAKPLSNRCWRFNEVEDHWDRLILRSFATTDGIEQLYQEASVAELLHPRDLLAKIGGPFDHGSVLFGGTVPVKGVVHGAELFRVELHDPMLDRSLACEYQIRVL